MANSLLYLYLSRPAAENLPIGLAAGKWGLTDEAVHRRLEWLGGATTGLEILRGLDVGDQVLAASGGPQPRVKRGGWNEARIARGTLLRVTERYQYDDSPIWPAPSNHPAEHYPHRFGIELEAEFRGISRDQVDVAGMDALHYSANIGGLPVPVDVGPAVVAHPGPLAQNETDDPAFLLLDGDLDATALVSARREQRKLRSFLFNAPIDQCCFCGRTLPIECLRTAHIKKRSRCTEQERRDLANIARACTLGCDHLFELGYIYVDPDGIIQPNSRRNRTPELDREINGLSGRRCGAHAQTSEAYFRWHREEVAK